MHTYTWAKYRHAEVDEDLSEFLNDGSWKRGYIANRLAVVSVRQTLFKFIILS